MTNYCPYCLEPIDFKQDHVARHPEDGEPVHAECQANWEGREA